LFTEPAEKKGSTDASLFDPERETGQAPERQVIGF
jgi:hypothetical protein